MEFRRRYDLGDLSDEELIAYAVAAREASDIDAMREGLGVLNFRRFDDLVRRALIKIPPKDAEDVASQTMNEAVLSRFQGTSVGEFMNLVNRILQRRIADYYGKKERTLDQVPLPEENTEDDEVHGSTAAISPDETTGIGAQDVIDRQFETLSDEHRLVIERYILEDLAAEDAAAKVNEEFADLDPPMSVDNVHKIASRFRKDLRKALEESD